MRAKLEVDDLSTAIPDSSHGLRQLRRFKPEVCPLLMGLRQATEIGAVTARWENLYFNPFPAEGELRAIAHLISLNPSRFQKMLPHWGMTLQPRPIRLCGACYAEVPCHRMVWQHKNIAAVCLHHPLRLLERYPSCKKPFQIPALWTDWRCHHCEMRFTRMVKYQERIKQTG